MTGYYSLIQYCPDATRLEVVNVGVLLFVRETGFRTAYITGDHRRVRQFFGDRDWGKFELRKVSFVDRLEIESIQTLDDLEGFIATRANDFRMTKPRQMKVVNAERDLRELFQECVEGGFVWTPAHNPRQCTPAGLKGT